MNARLETAHRGRRAAVWALKLAVTVSLIAWMFSRISLRELSANLRASLGLWLLAAVLVAAANVTLGGVRWRILLNATGTPIPLGEAVRLVWSGLFFNTLLPPGWWAMRSAAPGLPVSPIRRAPTGRCCWIGWQPWSG